MNSGAAKEASELSEECVSGRGQKRSRNLSTGLNWNELLSPERGGPGDSPGRSLAIEKAKQRTAERYATKGRKKAKGGSSKKPVEVSRKKARKAGW